MALLAAGCVLPLLASADEESGRVMVAVGGGLYLPFDSWDPGYTAGVQVLRASKTRRWRFGVEVDYRSFRQHVFGADDIDAESIVAQGLVLYVFDPEAVVTPYLGGAISAEFTYFDQEKIDEEVGAPVIGHIAYGVGIQLIVGADYWFSQHFSLYGEGRAGYSFTPTRRDFDRETLYQSLSGMSLTLGLRTRF
jgi:hypothetical protein